VIDRLTICDQQLRTAIEEVELSLAHTSGEHSRARLEALADDMIEARLSVVRALHKAARLTGRVSRG
jgi:hypothetical protein